MAKRANGEGYIYKNQRGLWIVRTQIGWQDNGNPKFKTFSGQTRKEALIKKDEYMQKAKSLDNLEECTLETAMNSWLNNKKKKALGFECRYLLVLIS